ncbi:MAG TPA: hypothetical protein VHN98_06750 [Acidimicrobiales bacterium]|nr:hypothetical protein [Acidimicrobiales bacterium]
MPRLTAMDELFVHQIPEPLPNVALHHEHWRESLFFVMQPRDQLGDVVILTLAHFPARGEMDALQLGRVGGAPTMMRHARPYDGDPHTMAVGPVTIDIEEPFRRIHLRVEDVPAAPVALDLVFEARTQPVALRRGTMRWFDEVVWDQSHMIQSGSYSGWYRHQGTTYEVDGWWGQRDHSWGIRDHARCPFWMWLALQLPEGMIGLWHWEYPNGSLVFSDGAFAPADGSDPIPIVRADHQLHWIDESGKEVSYGRDGTDVTGVAGRVDLVLEGGRRLGFEAEGRWAQRYGPLGGGLNEVRLRTDDGSEGTGIIELTGAHHHRYFPEPRATRLPPNGK